MSKKPLAILLLLVFSIFVYHETVQAQNTVAVTGDVATNVSAANSSFVADVQTVPADGSSHVTLTATLVDPSNHPVEGSVVQVSSNRGSVETILCYQGSTLTSANHATSDADGVVKCVASSTAPGQATFTALVDEQTTLHDQPVVTFTALPILQNLTITVTLPGGKKLTIFQPAAPSSTPVSPPGAALSHRSGTGQLVSTGINLELSLWTLLLIIFFVLLTPLLFVGILLLLRRLHRQEQLQLAKVVGLEEQIAATEQTIETKLPPTPPPG